MAPEPLFEPEDVAHLLRVWDSCMILTGRIIRKVNRGDVKVGSREYVQLLEARFEMNAVIYSTQQALEAMGIRVPMPMMARPSDGG